MGALPPARIVRCAATDLQQLDALMKTVESVRLLTCRKIEINPATDWLDVCWADGPRVRIAWHQPAADDPVRFERLAWPLQPGLVTRSKFIGDADDMRPILPVG